MSSGDERTGLVDQFVLHDSDSDSSDETVIPPKDEVEHADFSDIDIHHDPKEEQPSTRDNNGEGLATLDLQVAAEEGGVLEPPNDEDEALKEKEAPVTWMSLPHKRQLVILTLARLSEPLVQTSLQVRFIYVSSLCCRQPYEAISPTSQSYIIYHVT